MRIRLVGGNMKNKLVITLSSTFILTLTILFLPSVAKAALVYKYEATCESGCFLALGLNDGDPVMGTIEFDNTNFAPFANIGEADVVDFTVNFGSVSVDFATVVGYNFSGILKQDATTFLDFNLFAADSFDPAAPADAVLLQEQQGFAGQGWCQDPDCNNVGVFIPNAQLGSVMIEPIPVPAAVWLFIPSLLGLWGITRKRVNLR